MEKKETGKNGENISKNYLLSKGYIYIQSNYHSRYGEIDLIFMDNQELVFVEIKTRTSDLYGLPIESMSPKKRLKILKTALTFLDTATPKSFISWRIDFIGIKLNYSDNKAKIQHIKNI